MFNRFLLVALCAAATALSPSDGPAQTFNSDFQAKRVKPPAPGTKKRITVQVAPRANPAVPPLPRARAADIDPPDAPVPEVQDPIGRYAWFWDQISPELTASAPGRLEAASQVLRTSPQQVQAPRLQQLQDITRAHGIDILTSTIGTQVSPALVLAVISVESAGQTQAVSTAGATGLMQLMPATADRFGVEDRTIATQNIWGGVKYLDWLMGEFGQDPILVLAGYNAGEGAVRDHAGVPPYAETRDYVPKVLAAFEVAKALCRTPPDLISDGCVFVAMN